MAKDILDAADSEEVVNLAQSSERPLRTYEIDFGLPDPHSGSRTYTFGLHLQGFLEIDTENLDSFIMEFEVVTSDCPTIQDGAKLSHFIQRDGDKRYLRERAAEIRDAVGGTLGKKRGDAFSVKDRVMELLQKTGEETLADEEIFIELIITREQYTRGKKSPKAGEPGHKIICQWSILDLEA